MAYKRILTIQDISCVGQCSMTVALPILSACGHETCILPTAVLSTHTGGFGKPVIQHLSVEGMWNHWKEQGIDFDAILVGYLGSVSAIETVSEILDNMLAPGGIAIVDPAMADHGKLYSGFDDAYAAAMQKLCEKADIMIPNLTEAAMMAGMEYRADFDESYIYDLLDRLPGKDVVLTGVGFSPDRTGAAVRRGGEVTFFHTPKVGKSYSGTGDMFAACFAGALMQEKTMEEAVSIACRFTLRAIEATAENPAHWYGVKFETALPWLINQLF
jgi:pyridoxine kinase